jgi:vesicle-associated membrane protein 2
MHFVSDALQQGASQFEQQAGKLKRKFWWKNLKVCNVRYSDRLF